jgi:hypothetical protein
VSVDEPNFGVSGYTLTAAQNALAGVWVLYDEEGEAFGQLPGVPLDRAPTEVEVRCFMAGRARGIDVGRYLGGREVRHAMAAALGLDELVAGAVRRIGDET